MSKDNGKRKAWRASKRKDVCRAVFLSMQSAPLMIRLKLCRKILLREDVKMDEKKRVVCPGCGKKIRVMRMKTSKVESGLLFFSKCKPCGYITPLHTVRSEVGSSWAKVRSER